MRPKLLEIEGLQSFTDVQRIDFETLGETGIFGIFGPTGSGKSTILDAITFALYGKVKRAEGGTQGIINSGCNTARVSFTFELAREGKRRLFRVERTYQRKKNSPNSCEPKIARLIEVTDSGEIPLCDKATEVSNQIKELLGLGNEDFTRAVVLPQNSFQEFLLLENSKRREMLERIFYLEEYGKQLTDKLGRKMAGLKSRIDIVSGELMGYADASDEALETARKTMEESAAERSRIENELKQSEIRFNEAREVWGLVCELADFARKEEELDKSRDLILDNKMRLDKAIKADGLSDLLQKNRELNNKLGDTKKQLDEVMTALPGITAALHEITVKYEGLKSEAATGQPKLVEQRTRLSDALSIKGEIAEISGRIAELQSTLNILHGEIEEKNGLLQKETAAAESLAEELDRLRHEMELLKTDPEYRQHVQEGLNLENSIAVLQGNVRELETKEAAVRSNAGILESKLDEIREVIARSQKAIDEMTLESQRHDESKPGDRNAVLKAIERVHSVQGICNVLKLRKTELDQVKSRLELQQSNLDGMVQKLKSLEKARDLAGEECERRRLELEESVREIDKNTAYLLSKNLKEGEPCPVCGSTEHPSPALHTIESDMPALEHAVETARARLSDAEKALMSAEREAIAAAEQVKTLTEQKSVTAKELEDKTAQYREEWQKLPDKLRSLELEQVIEEVERCGKACSEKLEAIDVWENKRGEYRESLQKLNQTLIGHKLVESGFLAEQKVNRESLEQLKAELAGALKQLEAAGQKNIAFLREYGIESASGELKRIADNDRKIQLLQKESDRKQKMQVDKRNLADKLKEDLRLLNAEYIKQEAAAAALKGQMLDKEARVKELAGEADIEEEIGRIDARLEEYRRLENEYSQKLQESEKQYNELLNRKTMLENQKGIYAESLKNDEMRLNALLAEKGFADASEVERALLSAAEQKELKTGIDEYEQAVTNIKAQKEMLQKKLKSRTITEEEWNRINIMHTELAARSQECISRSEVAKSNYELLDSKHSRWVELGRDYAGLSRKYGLYEQIQKILKAEHRKDNSFIDYIAEERLRYVAAKASETIGIMTKYRYALELDAEAGFIIRDNANGGVHRMVTSLSGGETFLTSLALALALSEQIQLKGQSPLEFFFLDEGFGTLDADLLDTVIDSLERLSSRDRVIGLISHVPELRNRIGRRLVVEPPTLQNPGSRVFIEKA